MTRPTEEDEGVGIDVCENDRCKQAGGDSLKLWHCVRCDSTYCTYEEQGQNGVAITRRSQS